MVIKSLVITAVFLAANGCIVHGEEQRAKTTKAQSKSDPANDQDSRSSVVIIDSGNAQPQPQQNSYSAENETQDYLRVLFAPNNLPTDALVVVGFVTLWVLWTQAVETRKAAQAALFNAEALISAERPWFVVECSYAPGDSDQLMVQCVNMGRTPGDLCEGHSDFAFHPLDFKGPGDDFSAPFWLPIKTFLVTNDGFEIGRQSIKFLANKKISTDLDVLLDDQAEPKTIGPYAIFAYGWISYWDTFTDRTVPGAKPHVTKWLFRYEYFSKKLTRCAGNYAGNK